MNRRLDHPLTGENAPRNPRNLNQVLALVMSPGTRSGRRLTARRPSQPGQSTRVFLDICYGFGREYSIARLLDARSEEPGQAFESRGLVFAIRIRSQAVFICVTRHDSNLALELCKIQIAGCDRVGGLSLATTQRRGPSTSSQRA